MRRYAFLALPMLLTASAAADTILYAVRSNGDLVHVNPTSGSGSLIGSSGIQCRAAASFVYNGGRFGFHADYILLGGSPGALADQITALNRPGPFRRPVAQPATPSTPWRCCHTPAPLCTCSSPPRRAPAMNCWRRSISRPLRT
jgi:hypothetical protein